MTNRLADSTSPYLRQHATNPIDWWEWSDEAFETARTENRPVLLSVGYASCHWCHVMAHESFSDAHVAQFINEHFVAIKVDRQQRPDVDAVYMRATQALTGAGGWPMTCFLTPEGLPFFAGTYFPPEAHPGQPSFRQVLEALADAWAQRGDEVVASATEIAAHLARLEPVAVAERAPDLGEVLASLRTDYDLIHGGFGRAPKFPPASVVDALLVKGDHTSVEMAQVTLEAMARGGICDQVGGGFHRYAVDAGWVVPHFEKMLYDNALLLGSYLRGWRRTADHDGHKRALFERTAYGIVEFVERELRTPGGAFASGLDADSCDIKGSVHEGIFYLWSPELLRDALGDEDAAWAEQVFHVTQGGTFDDGLSTLQLRGMVDFERLERVTRALLKERTNRFRPATDELVVASWNGWMITSLVTGAMMFNEPGWLDLARACAQYLVDVHLVDGRLRRSSLDGVADGALGGADDFGAVAEAFATLAGALGDEEWLRRAVALCDQAVELFGAPDGGFFDAADAGLFERPRQLTDPATPSGTSSLVAALRRVCLMSGRADLGVRAQEAARTTWATVAEFPRHAGSALADLLESDEAAHGLAPAQVVVVSADPFDELARAAWRLAPNGSVIVTGAEGTAGFGGLFDGRSSGLAYVCREQTCFEPVASYVDLKDPLWRRT